MILSEDMNQLLVENNFVIELKALEKCQMGKSTISSGLKMYNERGKNEKFRRY
jgi:hypothetical protein